MLFGFGTLEVHPALQRCKKQCFAQILRRKAPLRQLLRYALACRGRTSSPRIPQPQTSGTTWRSTFPGKTAQECQNRLWAAHPTPKGSKGGNPGAYALAAEADSDNSPLMPPPRKNAAGQY